MNALKWPHKNRYLWNHWLAHVSFRTHISWNTKCKQQQSAGVQERVITFSLCGHCWKARSPEHGNVWLWFGWGAMKPDCRTRDDRFCCENVIQRLMILQILQFTLSQESDARYSCVPLVESSLSSSFQSWFRAAINPEEAPVNEGWWDYAHKYKGFRTRAFWRNSECPFTKLVNL